MSRLFIDGNEAVARAALTSGCKFFAGYPITPATTIFQHMLELLPPNDGICLQGEDEIASIGFCIGASMAGLKAMTATSGPGISLFSEQISFAIAGEIPLVIIDVQRLGPSTGSATRGADSDIQFLRWGNSGGLPVIVLAPIDSTDCYNLTCRAFNLAERYRCPVFLASNKEIGMTREVIDEAALVKVAPLYRTGCGDNFSTEPFQPFAPGTDSRVPPFLPMGGKTLVRQTSSSHGPDGFITTVPEVLERGISRMRDKLLQDRDDLSHYRLDNDPQADILLITYGVTSRAAQNALYRVRDRSFRISLLTLQTLYPVPEKLLREEIAKVSRVIAVEMNLGQYVREIERLSGATEVEFLGKMNGELISPEEIVGVIGS
ncbi:MAG: pyruvate flavodoxin/ferredoxin oxidoreductase [Desulfofustis sp.]|nr:pyruvate flavodoxin/ferredoxin oxidoreductase [Desulfofustis sp.]MBT8353879.1 pyruvate flavodoxin/ferredoxin oxidoreductase [Desulfofustis sp.]NNF47735.1 pyruvate flavodoxin/ferredoxin oxidoreductase [Desulfofustis sp.]NNK57405.1 pyruvate flavodoxin/ferredoxin oxidoreductase [Desulfofustis sp.]